MGEWLKNVKWDALKIFLNRIIHDYIIILQNLGIIICLKYLISNFHRVFHVEENGRFAQRWKRTRPFVWNYSILLSIKL